MNPLDADFRTRAPAPSTVWHWQDCSSWREAIREVVSDVLDARVKDAIVGRDLDPSDFCCDDLSWLDEIVLSVHGATIDCVDLLAGRVEERFTAIRAAHGTRTRASSFYDHGIRPPNWSSLLEEAIRSFGRAGFGEMEILRAVEATEIGGPDGCVYVEANEAHLVEHCAHYMIYGSEDLLAVASHLGPRGRAALRDPERGAPMVFVCDVPMDLIGYADIRSMAGEALTLVCSELLGDSELRIGQSGLCIRGAIPPENIVGHYSPKTLVDPIEMRVVRRFDDAGAELPPAE